jgi:hypothetical protein
MGGSGIDLQAVSICIDLSLFLVVFLLSVDTTKCHTNEELYCCILLLKPFNINFLYAAAMSHKE